MNYSGNKTHSPQADVCRIPNLKSQYQSQLDTETADIESALKKVAEQQATIATPGHTPF
jgi:hypothetical protein